MSDTRVPAALLAAVKADMRSVRPLASPAQRALWLLPLGILLLVVMPAFWTWRASLHVLMSWSWSGLSVIEMVLSLFILAAAFREAVPGRELSAQAMAVLTCIAGAAFLGLNPGMPARTGVAAAVEMRWIRECIVMAMSFSIPALAVPAWLVSRALANRPALAGALCGLGVGVMADAGLRLLCWDGDHVHVLLAHGGAIAILVLLGALSALLVERIKVRRRTLML